MTRNGPAVETGIGTGTTALNNPVSTNGNYVVGRYAYAAYDEDGLLDINVAGYPSPTPAATSLTAGPSVRDLGRKGVLAFADLTALPTTPGNYMSPTAINTLIGFRNYATMQLSGVSGLNFPPSLQVPFPIFSVTLQCQVRFRPPALCRSAPAMILE